MRYEEMIKLAGKNKSRKKYRNDEHKLQVSMVNWFRLQYPSMRHNLFAVPNGGRRDAATGRILKDEGVLAGVSDLILLKSNQHYGALLIETKTKKGTQRESQKEWESKITADGYKYVVVRSLDDFIKEVNDYLKDL
ncbi:VRR-NUC domain-containing protein [Bacteroides uniformis]|jgi:hypothetical protein|uniref:VRR-NUC domain-containing protein n=1 Tax=Bacteroides uniformis TaxID=820 RepID=UPI001920FAA2|nr:VRR-NUC domain-containing protein [Bacteroides uniformis]